MQTSRFAVGSVVRRPGQLRALALTSGQIELVKWLALAFMLIDHVNAYVLSEPVMALRLVGRLAYPLFAIALGMALRERDRASLARAARRTLIWGLIAQPVTLMVRDEVVLNILLVLGVALLLRWLFESGRFVWLALWGSIAVMLAQYGEFQLPGLLLAYTAIAWGRAPRWWNAVAFVAALASLQVFNHTHAALFALPLAMAISRLREVKIPHVAGTFQASYVLHWPVVAAVRSVLA